jgi:MFS family permease
MSSISPIQSLIGSIALSLGYVAASYATSLWLFALAHGLLIAQLGGGTTFRPIVADVSHWFTRRRDIAVAIAASGNYLAGTIRPPLRAAFHPDHCLAADTSRHRCALRRHNDPLTFALRRTAAPDYRGAAAGSFAASSQTSLGLSPGTLQIVLGSAAVSRCRCRRCISSPIAATSATVTTHGAEMLSQMFGLGSRVGSDFVADRFGGWLATLLLASTAQMLALLLYFGFSSLTLLYVISAMFGLVQGGIIPSYAIIIREYLPAREAGMRFGMVIMAHRSA